MKYNLKFSLLSTLVLTFCLNLSTYAVTPFEWKMTLHFAGKQRMLTQKMCKEILFIYKDINVEENKRSLNKTAQIFEFTLKGLQNGEKRLHLVKITNSTILQQLNIVTTLWNTFHQHVEQVLMGNTSKTLLKKVADQNMLLLIAMDKAVKLYEKEGHFTLEASRLRVMNLAGKQRMLTQKMTKELLLIANHIMPEKNQANLKKTMRQFERILNGLLNGDSELGLPRTKKFAFRNQLGTVRKIWEKYKSILNKSKISQEDLVKASRLNMLLLKEMNNAMKIS